MKEFLKKHGFTILFAALSVAFMFAAWAISWSVEGNELVVPSISSTLSNFFKLFAEEEFWASLGMTFLRTVIAVIISFVVAVLCILLGFAFAPFKAFLSPVIAVCRTVPTMAVTLIIMLVFGAFTPIIVTMLVIFPMLYAQISTAVDGVDKGLLDMAKTYNVKKSARITKIILPQVAPAVVGQLGSVISFGLKLTISAEVLAYVNRGIGDMIKNANFSIAIARMSALTLVAVVAGLLVEWVFYLINKFAFKWRRV
ncbi:MAG: ABC transporter permease subunit [Clostridia bacterium]|nr:ABC transporter permease subunit [Clostridia bacterium]